MMNYQSLASLVTPLLQRRSLHSVTRPRLWKFCSTWHEGEDWRDGYFIRLETRRSQLFLKIKRNSKRSIEFRLPVGTRSNISGTNETPMIWLNGLEYQHLSRAGFTT